MTKEPPKFKQMIGRACRVPPENNERRFVEWVAPQDKRCSKLGLGKSVLGKMPKPTREQEEIMRKFMNENRSRCLLPNGEIE